MPLFKLLFFSKFARTSLFNASLSFSNKNFNELISKIEYRIGSLVNAHKYSSVANQDEVEKDTSELNQLVSNLNNEILDIENIGIEMGTNYEEPKYKELSSKIDSVINSTLDSCNEAVRKATDVLGHKFDSLETEEASENKEASFEYEIDAIEPNDIKTDSIEDIEKELNQELQPVQEDKKELEDIKQDLNEGIKVTNIEPAPESTISPVLMPEASPDLNSFLDHNISEAVIEYPVAEVENNEMKSAPNVDEGYVKVESVQTFDLNENREGPVLSRAA